MASLGITRILCIAVAWVTVGSLPCRGESPRPNIIILIADDLNDSIEGMGGHPQAQTPHIDRLCKRGVRFQNAACNSPLCGPSRASLWSGLAPWSTGLYGYEQQANDWRKNRGLAKAPTIFEQFARNGYRVYATGKIHHNGHEKLAIFKNTDGFSGFGSKGNFGPVPNDGKPEHLKHGVLPPWMPEAMRKTAGWGIGYGPIQDLSPYGNEYLWTAFNSGIPWQYRNGHDRDPMPDEVHADEALAFLKQNHHQKPFFLTVGFSRPHSPLYAPREYFERFPIEKVQLAAILDGDPADCASILARDHDIPTWGWNNYRQVREVGGIEQLRLWTQAYLACVAFVDDQIGRVLDGLAKSPHADNTIVIVTSDHGFHMGEKEFLFKMSPWEESARVPLVIAGPGVAQGEDCTTPVSLIDLYPTCIDYAGIPAPPRLDGASLRPLLENPRAGAWTGPPVSITAAASKEPVPVNTPAPVTHQHFSLRSEQYRYIRCRDGSEELYDHAADPHEWKNLAADPGQGSEIQRMRSLLAELVPGVPTRVESSEE